jgi:CHAD domain-containing protein
VAPLAAGVAATLAAGAAIGAGAKLARAELDRRDARRTRRAQRQFALLPSEQLGEGLKRIALGQLELAAEQLEGQPDSKAVHETRKALKRLRALVRMLEGALDGADFSIERGTLRDAGRRLAGARDAEVLVNTLDQLLEDAPPKLARRHGVTELRARLADERDRADARLLGDVTTRMQVLGELHALRARVHVWPLADDAGLAQLDAGVRGIYQQGRRRYRRAADEKRHDAGGRQLHEWRKRVKDLRYAAEMLEREAPKNGRERKRVRRRRRALERQQQPIHTIAARADELGEVLGQEHDLAVLAARIAEGGLLRRGTARRLRRQITKRRRALRHRALREGERLYGRQPGRFMRRVRRAYTQPLSLDGNHGQLPLAPWQGNGHPFARGAPQQRGGERGVGGETPFPRSGVVRAHDVPALLRSLIVTHDDG